MELRPGYKQTEMGPIPDDWATEPLVQIGRWFSGGTPSLANKLYWTGNIPWVSPKDMKLPRLWDAIDHISLKAVSDGARVLPVGTVLMVIRGMILAHSFPVARLECPSACNQDMKALVTRADIDSNFVLFWLTANRQNLRSLTTESTHGTKRLPSEILFRQIICLPPLPEQRAIATALSDVDTLISGLDQLIAKKRDIKQATMQQLLTGQTRLPGFSGEWEVKRLGDVAIFLKGKGLPKSALSPFGEKPCIHYGELFTRYPETIGAIISRTNGSRESFRSIANDVLMPTSDVTPRGLAKASCIKVNDVILGGDILVIRPEKNRICGSYLSYVIRSEEEQVLQLVTGSTVFHLYGSDMKKFLFLMPPLDEQTAITTVLSDMDAELAALEQRRDKTRDMKQGMMQELLTGRIRLI